MGLCVPAASFAHTVAHMHTSRSLPQTSVFFSGIVTALDGDVAHVVFGQSGSEWVWVKDAAEPGVTVMHCLGFRATLQVRGAPRVMGLPHVHMSSSRVRVRGCSGSESTDGCG